MLRGAVDPLDSSNLAQSERPSGKAATRTRQVGRGGGSNKRPAYAGNKQRSIAYLRARGFTVADCEKWVPGPPAGVDVGDADRKTFGHRSDMFGCLDLVALGTGETIGVQVTSIGARDQHIEKIFRAPDYRALIAAGWKVHLHAWEKVGSRWQLQVVDCT